MRPVDWKRKGQKKQPEVGFDCDIIAKLEAVYLVGGDDEEAALWANIGIDQLKEYIKKNPEFEKRKKKLKNNTKLKARFKIDAGIDESYEFALKVMERINKKEFSLKSEIGFTDTEGKDASLNVNIEKIGELTDEQLLAVFAQKKIRK